MDCGDVFTTVDSICTVYDPVNYFKRRPYLCSWKSLSIGGSINCLRRNALYKFFLNVRSIVNSQESLISFIFIQQGIMCRSL